MWSFAEAHPEAAIICGQLLNADGSRQIPSLLFRRF
jgi:hypothetical protein